MEHSALFYTPMLYSQPIFRHMSEHTYKSICSPQDRTTLINTFVLTVSTTVSFHITNVIVLICFLSDSKIGR